MKIFIAYFLASLLTVIAIVHAYWGFGGRKGFSAAIPSKDGIPLFEPGFISSNLMALLLMLFSYIILGYVGIFHIPIIPYEYIRWFLLTCSALFFLRSIGDFKYVGFTKKITNTEFGYWDTRIHSPLFLLISLLVCIICFI